MAKQVRIFLTCDLHRENEQVDGMATVAFGYEGKLYELDVCRDHHTEFTEALSPWATAARPYGNFPAPPEEDGRSPRRGGGRRSGAGTSAARTASKEQLAAIRDWARSQNMEVSERGRIPASVLEAFEKANPN